MKRWEPSITEQRFAELADAFGGDLQRWPEPCRGPAAALLERSGSARDAMLDAASVDRSLQAFAAPPPPGDALQRRILAAAPIRRSPAPRRHRWRDLLVAAWAEIGGVRYAGPAFAASLALGAVLAMQAQVDVGDDFEMPATLISEAQYQELLP